MSSEGHIPNHHDGVPELLEDPGTLPRDELKIFP